MKLIIAEKPSVAQTIAAALGVKEKKDGFIEGGGYLISWCVGHLVQLAEAAAYGEQYKKWSFESLPILPEEWQYAVDPDKGKQFKTLKELMHRADVSEVVNACDAGREGELIFRFVYETAGCKKPMRRLWISSMEDGAIKAGFASLKDGRDYDALFASALCRAKADWLIGINATRLFSCLYGKTLNVGRVQTPTLKMLTDRDAAISHFQKEKYYHVRLDLSGAEAASERISDKAEAAALKGACETETAVCVSLTREKKTAAPPKLFDLTSLQREANRIFGYTAKQTLDLAQALYEKKLLTYPRTDSTYLTDDMGETAASTAAMLCGKLAFMEGAAFSPDVSRVLDSRQVSDHHAIIPTMELAKADLAALPESERNILTLAGARLLFAAAEPHTYEVVTAVFQCAGGEFTAKGKTVLCMGWKELERRYRATLKKKPDTDGEENALALDAPPFAEGQSFDRPAVKVTAHDTTPPKQHTEASLLSAMERAGNEDTDPDAERRGLGTPATRAAVIEKLVKSGFVERKKKQLLPTEKGLALSWAMPDQLKSAKLTAEWEDRLGAVERGELAPEDFMAGITAMLTGLVRSYRNVAVAPSPLSDSGRAGIGKCPRCGKNVVEGKKSFYCEGYHDTPSCGFALWKNDRFFTGKRKELTKKIAASLLKNGRVAVTGLFSEKKGVFYDATVVLDDDGGKFVRFKLEFDNKSTGKKGK